MRFGSYWWVDLTPRESYLYNWLFASISSVWGLQSGLTHWLQHVSSVFHDPSKRRLRRSINEQRIGIWYFLHWFGKLGSLILVLFTFSQFGFYYSLANDHLYLIFLIPLVLYLGLWPLLNAALGKWSQRLMLAGLVFVFGFSSVLASFNLVQTGSFAENMRMRNIHYKYELTVPVSKTHSRLAERYAEDVYICFRKGDTLRLPRIVIGPPYDIAREYSLSEFQTYLRRIQDGCNPTGRFQPHPIICLHIDNDVDMRKLREIKEKISLSDLLEVFYNTNPTELNLHSEDPEMAYYGIHSVIPPTYEFAFSIDSISKMNFSSPSSRPLPPPPPAPGFLCGFDEPCFSRASKNIMAITLKGDDLLLNGEKTDVTSFSDAVRKHFLSMPDSAIFWLDLPDDRTYAEYIKLKDMIYSTFLEMRSAYSLRTYGYRFDSPELTEDEKRKVRKKFSMRVWETTAGENRLRAYKRERFGVE
ncbi:MAG: hypothetical protein GC178_13220 [Flavobacteriales bacterium]|nr:hypothetical protein [Flavobacteriales bacterium]